MMSCLVRSWSLTRSRSPLSLDAPRDPESSGPLLLSLSVDASVLDAPSYWLISTRATPVKINVATMQNAMNVRPRDTLTPAVGKMQLLHFLLFNISFENVVGFLI